MHGILNPQGKHSRILWRIAHGSACTQGLLSFTVAMGASIDAPDFAGDRHAHGALRRAEERPRPCSNATSLKLSFDDLRLAKLELREAARAFFPGLSHAMNSKPARQASMTDLPEIERILNNAQVYGHGLRHPWSLA